MKRIVLILALVCLPATMWAQSGATTNPVTYHFNGVPTGTCTVGEEALNDATGDFYNCLVKGGTNGTWVGSATLSNLNGIIFVGVAPNLTIQAAVNAASGGNNCSFTTSCSAVIIPPKYAGTDTYNNQGLNVLVLDYRSNIFNQPSMNVPTFITSIDSDGTYPAGRDMNLFAGGPAGFYFRRSTVDTTTTATLSVGANTSVLVGPVNNHNVDLGNVQTGTLLTLFSIGTVVAPQKIYVGRETANNEQLTYSATSGCPTSGTWNIVDATHLCLNTTKTHSGTTDIEEPPDPVRFDFTDLQMRAYQSRPSQDATDCLPVFWNDTNGINNITLPSDTTCAAPRNQPSFQTGFNIITSGNQFSGAPIPTTWEAFAIGGPNSSLTNIDQGGTLRGFVGPFYGATTGNAANTNLPIRLQNNTFAGWRNAAAGDDDVIGFNGSDNVVITRNFKSESAADANVVTITPPPTAGSYRLRFVLSVSAANAATLGWTATWTDSNGNAQTPTNLSLFQEGTAAPALTFTTSAAGNYYGEASVDINNAQAGIVIKLTFTGTSFAAKASATIERVI